MCTDQSRAFCAHRKSKKKISRSHSRPALNNSRDHLVDFVIRLTQPQCDSLYHSPSNLPPKAGPLVLTRQTPTPTPFVDEQLRAWDRELETHPCLGSLGKFISLTFFIYCTPCFFITSYVYATTKNGHYHQQIEPTHHCSLLPRATMTATTTGLETQMPLEFQLF